MTKHRWRARLAVAAVLAAPFVVALTPTPAAAAEGFGPGSVTMARSGNGALTLFGTDTRGTVWFRSQVAGPNQSTVPPWSGWARLDDSVSMRAVAAEANADGRIELFGVTRDSVIFHKRQTAPGATTYTNWAYLDGSLDAITLARNADGRLELIGVHRGQDVLHRSQTAPNSDTWTPWGQVPGALRQVTAEADAFGRIEIVGVADDGALRHARQVSPNVNAYLPWGTIDGVELASATMARAGGGGLELWTTNRNGSIYGRHQLSPNALQWSAWVGAGAARSLAAETNAAGRVELVAVSGDDGSMWQRTQLPTVSSGGTYTTWSQWQYFGNLTADPEEHHIVSAEQAEYFVAAVQTPYAVVRIAPNVDLDLTNHLEPIRIAWGVRIIGERDAEHPTGPRIHLDRSTASEHPVLFVIGERSRPQDNVRISGLRIEGGFVDDEETENPDTFAIQVQSSRNVEIDHSEISGWSGAAITVSDLDNRLDKDHPDLMVHVHDNWIHHNEHQTGDVFGGGHGGGYGVQVGDGSYALVERNIFGANRHAIEGDGSPGTGYIFRYNQVRNSGGWNTNTYHTHQIDMHGSQTCTSDWDCGPAGEYMEIAYNRVEYKGGTAVKLRGTPSIGMHAHHNGFSHGNVWTDYGVWDGAFDQTETGLSQWDNRFTLSSADGTREAVCDFDGDGTLDDFEADGVLWWYEEQGRTQFLRAATEPADEITKFEDYNGDGRCDVFVGTRVYITAAPTWTTA